MKSLSLVRVLILCAAVAALARLAETTAQAYPPAPHHTLFGMVRNEWGEPLDFSGAEVFVEATNNVTVRATVAASSDPRTNYRMEVPMDAGTTLDLYAPTVMKRNQSFRLKVKIGLVTYLPLEMKLSKALGQPAQSTRLDLTLGEDTDNDGLPDAWEQALIDIYGGTLADIKPGDDLDGDGISNYNEYLVGTYAFDPADGFFLNIVGASDGNAVLEMFVIRNHAYAIESTADLNQQWLPTQFRLDSAGPGGELMASYQATNTVILRIQVPPNGPSSNRRFYRAKVQ